MILNLLQQQRQQQSFLINQQKIRTTSIAMTNHLDDIVSVAASAVTTSSSATVTATTIINNCNAATSTCTGSSPLSLLSSSPLLSFTNNPLMVGMAWMICSAVFTTYSTTKFIKYSTTTTTTASNSITQEQGLWKLLRQKRREQRQHELTQHPSSAIQQQPQRQQSMLQKLSPSSRLTMYRFAGSLILGLLFSTSAGNNGLNYVTVIQQRLYDTIHNIPILFIPSICLFIANFSNAIALGRIGIGLTYTSKCGIPIITVLLTLLLDGVQALPNMATLLSLVPIAFGIAAASWNTPTYEMVGFIMASISATAQSVLNVTSKRALMKANISGPVGQRTMAAMGLLLTISINLIQLFLAQVRLSSTTPSSSPTTTTTTTTTSKTKNEMDVMTKKGTSSIQQRRPIWLTFMAMIAYHIEYLLSFIFVTLVGPITYGTCDAIRRLFIILFGRYFFGGEPFTIINKIGITSAICGALCYSIVSSATPLKSSR